jgi:hypothetical protein
MPQKYSLLNLGSKKPIRGLPPIGFFPIIWIFLLLFFQQSALQVRDSAVNSYTPTILYDYIVRYMPIQEKYSFISVLSFVK